MNPIERLRDDLARRFPNIMTEIDPPADAAGLWQLDVRSGGGSPWIVIEWKPDLGFGVSTPGADDYGTRPDEVYANARAAYDRVSQLILCGGQTEPPGTVRLAELRHLRKLSQAEVAERAGIKQAAMARIEGRGDILLSTLHRVVSAMGGHLSIRAEFPDGTGRELSGLVLGLPAGPGRDKEGSVRRTGLGAVETTVESGAPSSPTKAVKPGPGKPPAKRGRRATRKSGTPGA
jgi:hypothetical protein